MDIRDAMEELEMIRDIFIDERCVADEESEDVTKKFEIAFSAMEKQMPKKIIHRSNAGRELDWICPSCKKFCGPSHNFCPNCGQAVYMGKD